MNIVNVADMISSETGKSYREENLAKQHQIPLGAIVKVLKYDHDASGFVETPDGLVLRVVRHTRDCDGTPLYSLSFKTLEEVESDRAFWAHTTVVNRGPHTELEYRLPGSLFQNMAIDHGFSEENLKVLSLSE